MDLELFEWNSEKKERRGQILIKVLVKNAISPKFGGGGLELLQPYAGYTHVHVK